jgi:predicted Zn-dependent protease with MMP-like domain
MRLNRTAFERIVAEALDDLPPFFQAAMNNVEVLVEPWPRAADLRAADVEDGFTLLGLYQGVPLTERSHDYGLVAPDTITLFQGPIEEEGATVEAIADAVRHTVIHELAHHFGISDDRLRELGAY